MSKYFNGYASFYWDEMTKEELIIELKNKCKYISELKRKYSEDVKQSQNSKAIEVLEQLKNDLFDYSVTINIIEHKALRLCNIRKVIDNQITELRGEKQ